MESPNGTQRMYKLNFIKLFHCVFHNKIPEAISEISSFIEKQQLRLRSLQGRRPEIQFVLHEELFQILRGCVVDSTQLHI